MGLRDWFKRRSEEREAAARERLAELQEEIKLLDRKIEIARLKAEVEDAKGNADAMIDEVGRAAEEERIRAKAQANLDRWAAERKPNTSPEEIKARRSSAIERLRVNYFKDSGTPPE